MKLCWESKTAVGTEYQAGFKREKNKKQQSLYIQISILSPGGNLRIWALPKSRRHRHMIKQVLQMACQLDNGESEKSLGSDLSVGK